MAKFKPISPIDISLSDPIFLDPSTINVDRCYQRTLIQQPKIDKIVRNFRKEAFGGITVGRRVDISNWCVDGFHRLLSAIQIGVKEVPCFLFDSKGKTHEAEIFLILNTCRTSVNKVDVFRAALEAGEPTIVDINRILKSFNLQVQKSGSWGSIGAANAIQSIYRSGGAERLREVLSACECFKKSSADMKRVAHCGSMLYMLCELHNRDRWTSGTLDIGRLHSKLSIMTFQEWREVESTVVGSGGNRVLPMVRRFINLIYNKSLRSNRLLLASDAG